MRALFNLSLQQMLGGKKIWILALFLCLPILLLILVLVSGGFDIPEEVDFDLQGLVLSVFLYAVYPQTLCVLAALLYGASLLAGEIEDKTLVYLFTRAQPRWKVLLGKYLATSTVLAVLTLASMSVAYLLSGMPVGPRVWVALAAAVTCACFTYTAVFALLGLLVPRRALPAGLIYAVVVEFILSSVPALVNELTTSFYLRSMAWDIAQIELPAEGSDEFEEVIAPILLGVDTNAALIALATIIVVSLSISAWVIHRRQWPLTEGV